MFFKRNAAPTTTTTTPDPLRRQIIYQPVGLKDGLDCVGGSAKPIGNGIFDCVLAKPIKTMLMARIAPNTQLDSEAGFCSQTMSETCMNLLFTMTATLLFTSDLKDSRFMFGLFSSEDAKLYDNPGINGITGFGFRYIRNIAGGDDQIKYIFCDGVQTYGSGTGIVPKMGNVAELKISIDSKMQPQFTFNGTTVSMVTTSALSPTAMVGPLVSLNNLAEGNNPSFLISKTLLETY